MTILERRAKMSVPDKAELREKDLVDLSVAWASCRLMEHSFDCAFARLAEELCFRVMPPDGRAPDSILLIDQSDGTSYRLEFDSVSDTVEVLYLERVDEPEVEVDTLWCDVLDR